MSAVADLIEAGANGVLGRVHARVDDARLHDYAAYALRALVGSLRAEPMSPPVCRGPLDVGALTRMLRELSTAVLDVIEPHVSARELRRVAEWFAATTERVVGDANRRFIAMLDALDDHVILLDPSLRIQFLNRATERFAQGHYGLPRQALIGRNTLDGPLSPAFKQYVQGLTERAHAGETVADEFLLPMPGGAVWHEHRFHPVHGPGGDIDAVVISSRDIHARKQAEGRLHLLSKIGLVAETSDFDDVLARAAGLAIPELADWSVFELVRDGQIQRSTIVHPDAARAAEAERHLGHARGPCPCWLEGGELGGRIYPLGAADDGALRKRDPELHALLTRFDAATAIVVPFVVMGTPIALATFVYGPESGRHHAAADLAIADEIARRAAQLVENARLHAEVGEALAYRERVMGILGHDLRNPVSAVLSLAVILERRADVPERTKEGLRHIHASAVRMEQMIATILDFTQLRFRGTPALALESCDVERLAREIVDELRAAHPGRAITLEAGGELCGRWDASRMGQVLSNLVGNALTHGDGESPVALGLTADSDAVFIAVTNHGPTIPSDVRGKLFEPFWQGAPDGVPRSRGLGLGLFIVQQIVHAHRGTIAVRSEDGETTFTVRLPR